MIFNKKMIGSKNSLHLSQDDIQRVAELDRLGRRLAKTLDQGLEDVSPQVNERLKQARQIALSKKKPSPEIVWVSSLRFAGHMGQSSTNSSKKTWKSFSLAIPMALLVAGLILVVQWQQDARINDIADVDVALLTDEVPPDAYADNGFSVFLKNLTAKADDSSSVNSSDESQLNK